MNLWKILTFFIVIVKELEFDIFQVCIMQVFLYNTFVIFMEIIQDKLYFLRILTINPVSHKQNTYSEKRF